MTHRIMPQTIAIFGLLAALIVSFAVAQARDAGAVAPVPSPDLRVQVACSPLTSAQGFRDASGVWTVITDGTPQLCRTKIQNRGLVPITDITVSRPTTNTLVGISAAKYGVAIPCTVEAGCESFDLSYGQYVIITENLTFNMTQDGRGLTTATAIGDQGGTLISGSATERTNLN